MTNLVLSRLARAGALIVLTATFGVAAGCGKQPAVVGSGGAGGAESTTTTSTSTSTSSSTVTASSASSTSGGMGGMGESTAAGTGGVGGVGGAGGAGGNGGMGGEGGVYMPPLGTAAYPAEKEQNNIKSTANVLAAGTKGFTGAIHPLGDVDVFEADVTVAGSVLSAQVSDGMKGCPATAEAYLRIFDENGSLLGADKSGSPGQCPAIDPAQNPALQGLASGKYYVQVESADINPILFYVVDIKVTPPVCGDGVAQIANGEQCDDGNTVSGDGCSATCQLEGNYKSEVEPNNAPATATPIDGVDGAIGAIGVDGDQDYYSFNVTTPGSSVSLLVSDGLGGCPQGFDSILYLYDSGNVQLATDDESGVPHCSAIQPLMYPAAANLAVGKYYVMVESFGNSGTTPFYVLGIKVKAPSCGDGFLQVGEQCDDGNTVAGDGCSPTCQLEGNFAPEMEPNDTQNTANPLPMGADGFLAAISPVGDQDYFSFNVTAPGSSVYIRVTDGINGCPQGFDSKLSLFNPAHALIAADDNGGTAKCSYINPATVPAAANLAPGTYFTRVEQNGNTLTQGAYVVKIKVVAPGCGDGVIQAGEQCDDGNTVSGDGCSSTCMAEAGYEIEPNDTQVTATPAWPGIGHWVASINPIKDHDYFQVTLAAPGTVTFTTHSVGDPFSCPDDTFIHLLDANGMQLMQNDDGGVFPCSSLSMAVPAGTFTLWVQRYQDAKIIPTYQLDYSVQ